MTKLERAKELCPALSDETIVRKLCPFDVLGGDPTECPEDWDCDFCWSAPDKKGMAYREIWEAACREGKGGMEDGRPWVETGISIYEGGTEGCRGEEGWCHFYETALNVEPCKKCILQRGARKFFWPSTESLPDVAP